MASRGFVNRHPWHWQHPESEFQGQPQPLAGILSQGLKRLGAALAAAPAVALLHLKAMAAKVAGLRWVNAPS
jgi:hypothetical protein